jgi:hypothetical protein
VDRLTRRYAGGMASMMLVLSPAAVFADARVAGRVVASDGTPAAGVKVRVVQTDTGVGFPLLNPTGPTRAITETVAGADGRYSSSLPEAYVRGSETDADWIVTASKPAAAGQASGSTSSFEFEVNTAVQEAPDLPLWDSTPAVSLDGYRARVTVPGSPPRNTTPYVFLGQENVKGTSGAFDVRALEPASGPPPTTPVVAAGRAYADVRVSHREGRTIYHQTITSPTVAPALPDLIPPSRGSPCKVTFADGRVIDARPCPATDGNLTVSVSDARPASGNARNTTTTLAGVTSVTVELITPVDVESVFVRDCHRDCLVEVSADGSVWAQPRNLEVVELRVGDTTAVARFAPVPGARSVRVSNPGGTVALTEISPWPARPPGSPPASASGAPPSDGVAVPLDAKERPVGVLVAAAFLLGVTGAGVAVVAVTRARRRAPVT